MSKTLIYRNLNHEKNNRGLWSIAELKGNVGKGDVVGYANHIVLKDVLFHVIKGTQESIQRGFTKTGKPVDGRSVHAWSIGEIVETAPNADLTPISYNPHKAGFFYRRDNSAAISRADYVVFADDGKAYAIGVQ
jgi:hypothetical protein